MSGAQVHWRLTAPAYHRKTNAVGAFVCVISAPAAVSSTRIQKLLRLHVSAERQGYRIDGPMVVEQVEAPVADGAARG